MCPPVASDPVRVKRIVRQRKINESVRQEMAKYQPFYVLYQSESVR